MDDASRPAVADLAARVVGGRPEVSLHPPGEHQSNRLWDVRADGRHLIAKEFLKPDEFTTAPIREHRALERLAALDIAPKPVHLEPEPAPDRGPVVLHEYLDGEVWDRRKPSPAQLRGLAESWLAMHSVEVDWSSRGHLPSPAEVEARLRRGFAAYAAWAEQSFPDGLRPLRLCLEQMERLRGVGAELASLATVYAFCRSDTRFANVVQRPDGRVGMIDWEDSGPRDPARDLADLAIHPNQEDLLSPADLRAFLDPYLAARTAVDPTLERRYELYRAVWPVFMISLVLPNGARRAAAGRLAGWTINGVGANDRLRRYLARAIAWPSDDFSRELHELAGVRFFPI